jgi:hypothetical protein
MTTPADAELGPKEHDGGLGPNAAAMRDLPVPDPEQEVQPAAPSVGDFYRGLADSGEVRNPTMRHLLAQAADTNRGRSRIWLDADDPAGPHGFAQNSEAMARQTIGQAVRDGSEWLDKFEKGVRTTDVMRGSRTLLDLGADNFDQDLLGQFSDIVGMDPEARVPAVPQSGEHAQPDRFATRLYDTRIEGIQVRAWSHRRDGESIWADQVGGTLRGDNLTKYSLVPRQAAVERAA